ncbi:hypothetical protein Tco_0336411 [Tanacetum coccineum]
MPVFSGSGGFYQNLPSYQQMHEFSENPMYVPGFLGYPMQDPQSDSANRKNKQVVGSPKHKKPSVFGKVKRLSGEDESSESDEDAETTPVANKNFKEDKFWNMPPLLKTPVLDMKKKEMLGLKPDVQVPLDEIEIDENLRFVEEPIEIVERDVKKLKRRRIPLVQTTVLWNSARIVYLNVKDQFRKISESFLEAVRHSGVFKPEPWRTRLF